MDKQKRNAEQTQRTRLFIQSLIIALIFCALISLTNVAWFWWLPLLSVGFISVNQDEQPEPEPIPVKVKNDEQY